MSRFCSSFRRLGFAAFLFVLSLPAGAACPPPARLFPVEPGRPEIYLSKSVLSSGLTSYEITGASAPVHGTLEEQSDRYVYRPQAGFWTSGLDSFLLHLSSLNRGVRTTRVETVLLLAALEPTTVCQQSFETGSASWPVFGDNLEIFGPEKALSGARSLRVYGLPGESSGLLCEKDSYGGGGNNGGGQQGSSANVTVRPPGRGAGSNVMLDPSPTTPSQMLILKLGANSSAEHRVWMYDDGEHLSLRLESVTGATSWIPIARAVHRLLLLQWPLTASLFNQRSGAALFVDGARVAELVPTLGNDVEQATGELQAGALEIAGLNPMYADLDDLAFQSISLTSAWSCQIADGFEDGASDPAWTTNGSITVSPAAAIEGQYGMAVPLMSGNANLRASLPGEDHRLAVRFRFDPNSASLPTGSRVLLTSAVTGDGTHAFALMLEGGASNPHLTVLDDPYALYPQASAPINLPNGPVEIDLDWRRSASSTVGTGTLRLWLGGELKATLTGLANFGLDVAEIRLGAKVLPGGSSDPQGTFHFDQILVVRGPKT